MNQTFTTQKMGTFHGGSGGDNSKQLKYMTDMLNDHANKLEAIEEIMHEKIDIA